MNRAYLLRPEVPVRLPYVQVGVVILSLCLPESQTLPWVQTEAAGLEGAPTLRVLNPGLARSRAFQTTLEWIVALEHCSFSKAVCLGTFVGNLPARVQPKTEAIYLFYFSSFYVSPVVEARDVCGPRLARTTSLKRCPYFSQGPNGEERGGERLILRQPVVTYSPTRIFSRKDRSRCSLCTRKCKLYFMAVFS